MTACPFDDSRRLSGINPYFDQCGAGMEALAGAASAATLDQ